MQDHYQVARKRMIEEQLLPGGVSDKHVLSVMGHLQRHRFVDVGMQDQAYLDRPLKIGHNQTISQPLIVGLMTQALQLKKTDRVLELGTGCGYQTAILSELAKEVFSIERIAALSLRARKTLYRLAYQNIHLKVGDGTLGWPEKAPFDAILVTAASPEIPKPLKEELNEGGRLVIPVGGEWEQQLLLIQKIKGECKEEILSGCRFVKLIGDYGWDK